MDRLVSISALMIAGIFLTGCAQTRSSAPSASVGHRPLPSLRRWINADAEPAIDAESASLGAPIRTDGWRSGINGGGELQSPRRLSRRSEPRAEPAAQRRVASGHEPPARQTVPGETTPKESARAETSRSEPEPAAPSDGPPSLTSSSPSESGDGASAEPVTGPPPLGDAAAIDLPKRDEQLRPSTAVEPKPLASERSVGEWAARVDQEIITLNELMRAVNWRLLENGAQSRTDPKLREMVIRATLDHLIDRSLVIQEARRNELKDAKAWKMIRKAADEVWEQEELPALLNRFGVEDRFQLERYLKERGESLAERIESHRLDFIYQQYLVNKMKSKLHVDLPEMRRYYFEHRDHELMRREETIVWREILIRRGNHDSLDAARRKIAAATERLQRGEPFEQVARAMSEGSTAEKGGLWETSPGSHASNEVNSALARLEPGRWSPVLESPIGYHIVQFLERRPAGVKSFEEVQDEIADILEAERKSSLIEDYLDALYKRAVVQTVFREYVPRHLRGRGAY